MRLTMVIDKDLRDQFSGMAAEHGTTFGDLITRGVEAIDLARKARDHGLNHIGFVSDPSKLDAELRGLFPERPHIVVR